MTDGATSGGRKRVTTPIRRHETTRPLTVRAFQMLDTDGNAVISRAEYDRPLANIVERLDRNDDGGLSMSDRWRHLRGPQKSNNAN